MYKRQTWNTVTCIEIFGRSAAIRNIFFTSFVNTIVKRCTTKAVIVPVIIVPAHENTRIIAVLIRPLITLPCRKAVLKFASSTTLGSSNAPLVRKSSWLFSEPSNTTTRGTITIRPVSYTHLDVYKRQII